MYKMDSKLIVDNIYIYTHQMVKDIYVGARQYN